jgi:2',3'-cyclic-nucleotide 2'-phosphodiesterase / 3'-nucleotidase
VQLAAPSHSAVRQWMQGPVGRTDVPLHSYFAVAQPTAVQALITAAQAAHLGEMIEGTCWADMPVLSAAAPFKTGGRGGPEYFTDVPEGPLLLRNAADIYVHPNRFAAIAMPGAAVREWLERAATAYARIRPGEKDQPLQHPLFPATCFEMMAGVSYRIDLSAPARYDTPTGRRTGGKGRIRDLRFRGKPIDPAMMFAVATNSHRLGVLQQVAGDAACAVIADGTNTLASRDVLLRHLARSKAAPAPEPLDWAFCALAGASVTLDTGPSALRHLADIGDFAPENLGLTETGFLRFRLHL